MADPMKELQNSISLLEKIPDEQMRNRALGSVNEYIKYLMNAANMGMGPVAIPPAPGGARTTSGAFTCPQCGQHGTTTYQ